MARCTKEESQRTYNALLDAAERVFVRRGVASTTLEQIATEAGVTRGAIYWHFKDKHAIFHALHTRVKLPMDSLFERLVYAEDPVIGIQKGCIEVMRLLSRDEHARNVFTIMRLRCEQLDAATSPYTRELLDKRAEVIEKFKKVFAIASRQGRLELGVTPDFAAAALYSFWSGVLWDYLVDPQSYPLHRLAPKLVANFFRGILRPVPTH